MTAWHTYILHSYLHNAMLCIPLDVLSIFRHKPCLYNQAEEPRAQKIAVDSPQSYNHIAV